MTYPISSPRRQASLIGIFILMAVLSTSTAFSQYKIAEGSSIEFTVKHFGIKTSGSFTGMKGGIRFEVNSLNDSQFDVTVDANTINTDNNMRDNHLRGESYFNVSKYPVMHFVSSRIVSEKGKGLITNGQLTIKDISKEVSIPFVATPTHNGYIFKGTFSINRKDFNVGGSGVISDEVEIQVTVVAEKEK